MDSTHIHLLITHLPIFGSALGALVLIHGLWTKSNQTKIAAYNIFLLSALGAAIAYFTGEAAEETVENIQGIAKNSIDAHEDFASVALVSLIILGASSLIAILLTLRKSTLVSMVAKLVLLISIIAFCLAARTGYLGGQIRHTEIGGRATTTQQQGSQTDTESDDHND